MEAFERLPPEKRDTIVQSGIRIFAKMAYAEASTDQITRDAGISKGLLFHYFGSKRAFYLHCLRVALERLITLTSPHREGDFFALLFASMDDKLRQCANFPTETHFVNLAARDTATEVAHEKAALFAHYQALTATASEAVMAQAVQTLSLKPAFAALAQRGLSLYTSALSNRYLLAYRETPDAFFANAPAIQAEMRAYLELMLHGIAQEETP